MRKQELTLPPDHPLSRHVRRVVTQILHASNLGCIRGEQKSSLLSPFCVSNVGGEDLSEEVVCQGDIEGNELQGFFAHRKPSCPSASARMWLISQTGPCFETAPKIEGKHLHAPATPTQQPGCEGVTRETILSLFLPSFTSLLLLRGSREQMGSHNNRSGAFLQDGKDPPPLQ